MAVKITNFDAHKDYHYFSSYYGFIDDENDFFIMGSSKTVIMITDDAFSEYDTTDYATIEEFLRYEFGTNLVKPLKKDDFDIEIKIK